jgi:hypothetical protein
MSEFFLNTVIKVLFSKLWADNADINHQTSSANERLTWKLLV